MSWVKHIERLAVATVYLALIGCGCYACATIAAPDGGDYDYDPPRYVGGNPPLGATHNTKSKIVLSFDEFIALERPNEKVIITPPQFKMPVIKAYGKTISVELKDTLLPNTTYTFDFTDALGDNNEKNILENFTYAFSTGDVIDSLEISGVVLNAENLEPMPNVMVGIHSDLSDTAFTHLPFLRTSMTNEAGRFWIRNMAHGTYHVFALDEKDHNFRHDQPIEAIAFYDSLIVPSFEPAVRTDTVWRDTITIETLKEVHYTRFTPDSILLWLFKRGASQQYLVRSERIVPHQLTMIFGAPITELPQLRRLSPDTAAIDSLFDEHLSMVLEQSPDRTQLTYWLTDSLVFKNDTLLVEANYLFTDSLNQLVPKTDTIQFNYKRPKAAKEPKKPKPPKAPKPEEPKKDKKDKKDKKATKKEEKAALDAAEKLQTDSLQADDLQADGLPTDSLQTDDLQADSLLTDDELLPDALQLDDLLTDSLPKDTVNWLAVDIVPAGSLDVLDTLKITFAEPLLPMDSLLAIHINQKVDTLWKSIPALVWQDTLNPRLYYAYHEWSYGAEYQVRIDSAAAFGIYDSRLKATEVTVKTPAEETYAHLYVKITGIEGNGVGELLEGSEKVYRRTILQDGELIFENLKPGKYYLRYIDDKNGNGQWDTGDYTTHQQPEPMYYFNLEIELKGYMELEQNWNVTELPIMQQKPAAITKYKPKVKKSVEERKKERQDAKKKTTTTRTSMPAGLPF
ncbi:hypothetical protein AGMMS4957_11240 [Bacteroidia bacterium]|nr:hypothetical protein AGMMS4957_11240 [Bacteroidia bacterium]